ncbi:MAG: glutamate racemase [Thermacetogeniaceae bacterium]
MEEVQPIGIFDSGVGGLTVVKFIFKKLPGERIVYFGDTAHLPYGSRTPEELIAFGEGIVSFLLQFRVKAIVAACNTSSSISLPYLKKKFQVPILGVLEPGVRAALSVTRNKRVGVIATAATVNSGAYPRAFASQAPDVKVFVQACPLFVPLVEAGLADSPEARKAAMEYLAPLKEAGIDTLVLGCTHYPFLAPVITEVLGEDVRLVDPAEETVKELAELLKKSGRRSSGSGSGPVDGHLFFTSGPAVSFYSAGKRFLGDFPFVVHQVQLDGRRG